MKKLAFKKLVAMTLVTLAMTSCLKKQDLEDPNVGPALSADDVTQKMMADVGVFGMEEMKKDEYSTILQSQIIEETSVTQMYQQDVRVSNITTEENGAKTIDFLMNFIDRRNSDNSNYGITFQMKSLDDLEDPKSPVILFDQFRMMSMYGCKQSGVTCHNLNVTNETFLLDPALFHESICADKDRCEVKTRTITMDMLKTKSDGSKQKINYTFIVAPQLPFLSRILKYCERSVVKANPRNYLQEVCLNVTNFRVGTNTP